MDDIEANLWNPDVTPASYTADREKYQAAILDQYKLYVEMADRISARRGLANTFFLTLNTAIFSLFGVLWQHKPADLSDAVVVLLALVAVSQCVAWGLLVRSYRLLNSAKFKVVGAMERKLPASPYWSAEWTALGEGKDWRLYLPLSHVETWVPILFGTIYLVGAGFLIAT
jgi:drug/metabolite transporter (DMT)-like permease